MLKRMLFLGAVALVGGITVRSLTAPRPAVADTQNQPHSALGLELPNTLGSARIHWDLVWEHAAPRFTSADFNADGSVLAWIDQTGAARRMDAISGKTLWQAAPTPGTNRVTVSPSGRILTWGALNPANPTVRVYDAAGGGKMATQMPLDGAVWSVAAVAAGAGAESLVATTGRASLYSVPLGGDMRRFLPSAHLPGLAESLDTATSELGDATLLLGMWQNSGIGIWNGKAIPRWQMQWRDLRRSCQVHLSGDGTTALAVSGVGPSGENAQISVWDARSGQSLWSENVYGSGAVAAVSADGQRIAVTFHRTSEQEGDSSADPTPGRKIVLFDRAGTRLFGPKGGSFFDPELLAISRDGRFCTVRNGGNLLTLDNRGRSRARLRLPAAPGKAAPRIQQIVATPDGTGLLLVMGDGIMRFYTLRESK